MAVETGPKIKKNRRNRSNIDTPNTYIHACLLSWPWHDFTMSIT